MTPTTVTTPPVAAVDQAAVREQRLRKLESRMQALRGCDKPCLRFLPKTSSLKKGTLGDFESLLKSCEEQCR